MKPTPIALPASYAERVSPELAASIVGIGNAALLGEPLLGLIASRECPGKILIDTLDRVPLWVKTGRVIVSGFHSPLEQQVLRSYLRRQGRVVKVLALGISHYQSDAQELEPLANGQMLMISAFAPSVQRTSRATALERNRLVLALATEVVAPHISASSPLAALLAERI